jgi:cell division protein ZapA
VPVSPLHRIKVLGRELQVRSEAPAEQVRGIEAFVNGRLAEVAGSLKGSDPQLVAILTLMNIAEEYLALVKCQEGGRQQETERLRMLLQKLGNNL